MKPKLFVLNTKDDPFGVRDSLPGEPLIYPDLDKVLYSDNDKGFCSLNFLATLIPYFKSDVLDICRYDNIKSINTFLWRLT